MRRIFACASLAVLALACGGSTINPDDAGADALQDAPKDTAQQDVVPGPLPCGTTTCQGTDLCVHPCCGGAMPQCVPLDDAGTCPAGFTASSQCYNLGSTTQGCMPLPCTPPPPYCAPQGSGQFCSPYNPSDPRDCYETCA